MSARHFHGSQREGALDQPGHASVAKRDQLRFHVARAGQLGEAHPDPWGAGQGV